MNAVQGFTDMNDSIKKQATKYPVILVHGIMLRELKYFKAFGKIEKTLKNEGFEVFTANTDAFGTIENNAEQLKEIIHGILEECKAEKVNIIAHSKGGLDTKYMISSLDMADKIASFTSLCTPHRGSVIATHIWHLPLFIKKCLAFFINLFYKIIGDKNPDSLKVCEQLKEKDELEGEECFSDRVYCQSYSTKIHKGTDCVLMAVPMAIYYKTRNEENDGVVSENSAKFEIYRGECIDEDISHTQIVDFFAKRKNRAKILAFYTELCYELAEMGF